MICHIDGTPMDTEQGSAKGKFTRNHYVTEEIKICPECGDRVHEYYSAERITNVVKLD